MSDVNGRLYLAIAKSNLTGVKNIIQQGADPNFVVEFGQIGNKHSSSMLMVAIQKGHIQIVEYLLSIPRCDANLTGNQWPTPLFYLIDNWSEKTYNVMNLFKIMNMLLSKTDLNKTDNTGCTVLHKLCCKSNISEIVIDAFSNHIDGIINTCNDDGQTPLMLACQSGHKYIAKMLIKRGADTRIRDCNNRTALGYAIKKVLTSSIYVMPWCSLAMTSPQENTYDQRPYDESVNIFEVVELLLLSSSPLPTNLSDHNLNQLEYQILSKFF